MKTVHKTLLLTALALIIAIVAALFYVLTNLDNLVKAAIEKYGSQATQTSVQVDSVRIQLKEGGAAVNGLSVANPPGFEAKHAFSLGEISSRIDIQSIGKQVIVIDDITIRAPQVFAEINRDKKTNLNELKKNLTVASDAGKGRQATASGKADAPQATPDQQPRLIIRRLRFEDGRIHARVVPLNNKAYQLKLPRVEMKQLGGNNGATPEQIAKQILRELSDQALAVIKQQGIDAELDKLKARAREKVEAEKAKLKDKADDKLETEKQKLEDKLKGLLKP